MFMGLTDVFLGDVYPISHIIPSGERWHNYGRIHHTLGPCDKGKAFNFMAKQLRWVKYDDLRRYIYAYVYEYIYIYICTYVLCVYIYIYNTYVYIYNICVYIYNICVYYIYIYRCTYVNVYWDIDVCVCKYIQMYIIYTDFH